MKRIRTVFVFVMLAAFLLAGIPAAASGETAPAAGDSVIAVADGVVISPDAAANYENVIFIPQPADYTYGAFDETGNAEGYAYRFLFNTGDEAVQVDEALAGATVSEENCWIVLDGNGGVIQVNDDHINALSAEDADVIFRNLTVKVNGLGVCEFGNAFGAAFSVAGDSRAILQNVDVTTVGAIMSTLNSAAGDVLVMDSTFHGYGTALDASGMHAGFPSYSNVQGSLTEVPWVLGLNGSLRATNVIGTANVVYYNDDATSNGWGVYSTDGGSSIVILNSRAAYDDSQGAAFNSLYGAYVMSLPSYFYGFDVDLSGATGNTYGIVARASFTIGASSQANLSALDEKINEPAPETNDSASGEASGGSGEMSIRSAAGAWAMLQEQVGIENIAEQRSTLRARYGVMSHGANGAVFDVTDTDIIADNAAFLLKEAYDVIHLDGSDTIDAPIIIHQQVSDDASMGTYAYDGAWAAATPVFLYDLEDNGAVPTRGATATMTDMVLEGDFYNTDTNGAYLDLTFDGTDVTGVISSGQFTHNNASYYVVNNPAFDEAQGDSVDNLRYICVDEAGNAYETTITYTLFGGTVYNPVFTDDNGIVTFAVDPGVSYDPSQIVGYCIFYNDAQYCSDGEIETCAAINDPVYVTLTGGSTWNVTGASFLESLTVEAGSTINGIVYVNDVETDVSAGGTWEGDIVVVRPDEYEIMLLPMGDDLLIPLDDLILALAG